MVQIKLIHWSKDAKRLIREYCQHDLWKPRVKHRFGATVRLLDPDDIEEKLEKRLGDEAKTASDDTLRWEEACRREDIIRTFVKRRSEGSKEPPVSNLARELGLSRATTYRMIAPYFSG